MDQKAAVFESSEGFAYAGSPRALFQAFLGSDRFADHSLTWALRAPIARALAARGLDVVGLEEARPSMEPEPNLDRILGADAIAELRRATIVVWGSEAYRRLYVGAGYWVTDSLLPAYLRPRRSQCLVQTWRGNPLGRFGSDEPESAETQEAREVFASEGRRLTHLVSPSQYASEKFIGAFRLGRSKRRSAIVQVGRPANDALVTATAEHVAAVRKRLDLPQDRLVALWAPSSRRALGEDRAGAESPALDVEALKSALGDRIVVLVRDSGNDQDVVASDGFARDVSDVSDVNDVFLASDVLITDYSDAVFDYAVTGKPIIVIDDERLGERDHGFYIDPHSFPGRRSSSTAELIEALRGVGAETAAADEAVTNDYETFNERFNPLADGHAAERALERIAIQDPHIVPPTTFVGRTKRRLRRATTNVKKTTKRLVFSASRRSATIKQVARPLFDIKRRLNYRKHIREHALNPKMIVFESFVGWKYSCNPRALYEAVVNDPRFDDFTLVWAFKDPAAYRNRPELSRATIVRYGSQKYYASHAEAKYWVSNSVVFPHMRLREGQVYVQTWHGTPLKRLGCDIEIKERSGVKFAPEEKHDWYKAEGRRFTFLLAQSPFAANAFESAFDLAASGRSDAVLVEGYPRNDFLRTHTDADIERIREQLDLPADKKIVLYAPTWRDDQHEAGVGYTLELGIDFDALRRELGDTHVILFRAHYLIANAFHFERYEGFVRDVSQIDDINELYVASDMLITDYSSVFFDYANLSRPILFYMYDRATYADQVRGFYLDIEQLPGPIVEHNEELIAAIRSAGSSDSETLSALYAFADCYAPFDDGHASERVLSRMLQSPGHSATR